MELEVYKKSDFYEDYISSQKEYYERENADAYFAEKLADKDKEIAELKADVNNVLIQNRELCQALKVMYSAEEYMELQDENAELKAKLDKVSLKFCKQLRHQKYKRCLAMARWCQDKLDVTYGFRYKHFEKWKWRWLELAERFKEAK